MCSVEVGKVVANSSISCFINEIHRTFSDNYCVKVELNTNYVGIKCQLDATEVFIAVLIACSTCFGHHYAHHQELNSIIQWLLPVVFRAVVFKLLVWCGAEGYVSGLQDAALAASCKPDQQLENHSTEYHRQQPLYNTLELLMMGIVVPETC